MKWMWPNARRKKCQKYLICRYPIRCVQCSFVHGLCWVGSSTVVKFAEKNVFHNITVTDIRSRQSADKVEAVELVLVGMRDGMKTHVRVTEEWRKLDIYHVPRLCSIFVLIVDFNENNSKLWDAVPLTPPTPRGTWVNSGETRGGVGKNGVLEHKSGNISETRTDRRKVTMGGPMGIHLRSF